MSLFEFKENDVFFNVMKTHPSVEFLIYSGTVYYNQKENPSGSFTENILGVSDGCISLYELNVDRSSAGTGLIYPFITKDGTRTAFATTTLSNYATQFSLGDTLTSSYPLSASATREYYSSTTRARVDALRNVFNYHSRLSPHYMYSSNLGNKATQKLNLISIPSIFYGNQIKKGTVDLKYYVTGTLIGRLKDENKNGELIQVGPTGSVGSGSVAGVVLYDEGFVSLTGSWALDSNSIDYLADPSDLRNSSWLFYGVGLNDGVTMANTTLSASYLFNFEGTEKIPTVTMLAHAERGGVNFSLNPTHIDYNSDAKPTTIQTSSIAYSQNKQKIKNTVSSSFPDPTGSFEKQVFITKIAIYDENKRIIGIASLANPVKKTEKDGFTFKLAIDL